MPKIPSILCFEDNTFTPYENFNPEKYYFDKDLKLVNATIEIHDPRKITAQQRKFIYAVIFDIAIFNHSYCDEILKEYYKSIFKQRLIEMELVDDYFSLSNCSISQANLMIDLILSIVMDYNIPLRNYTVGILQDTEQFQYHCIINRKCCVISDKCSKEIQIHHATNLVGMGNKRSKHDHLNSKFMALCSIHHQEIGGMGLDKFCEHYHVVPTFLSEKDIKKLKQ